MITLTELCQELHNWFDREQHTGTFTIENGNITADFLSDGQYYRICGSVFNDGLHKYGDASDVLTDETFVGTVWALAIPKAVVELAAYIEDWQQKNGDAVESPYTSESFGGYSYTKATDSSTGSQATWETVFRSQLNPYRKLRENAAVQPRKDRYVQWGDIHASV